MLAELRRMDAPALNEAVRSPVFRERLRALSRRERQAAVRYLAGERSADLGVEARAALIDLLQKGLTTAWKELAIRDLFLATRGRELTQLKRLIDRGADHRDLAHLIYHDIDLKPIRRALLQHIRREAEGHASDELKILSDVDDTFYRNWVDPRYPPRTVYPGVIRLFTELEGKEIGDLVFLTGRPGERSEALKSWFRRGLGRLGAPEAGMLTGSLAHQFVRPWIFSRKWRNFERYRRLFPEMRFVLFGDSGQADPEFIGRALDRYPRQVAAGLVHRVKPLDPTRMAHCLRQGVFFFDTYVGAATHLYELGLLGRESLERVAVAAAEDLARIEFPDPAARQARESELARDLKSAREAMSR